MSSIRLTIYLLRDVLAPKDALAADRHPSTRALDPQLGVEGIFYFESRPATAPRWASFVEPVLESGLGPLTTASASGMLVIRGATRFYALTFGYGKGFLDPSKIVHQFGLKVALNRIDPSQIRSMDTKTFEDMVVTKNTQSSKSTDLPTFGVDVSRDILRAVTGEPRDKTLAKRLSGSDALVVNLDIKPVDLPTKCDEFLLAYEDTAYKADFEWIDQLSLVADDAIQKQLDDLVVQQLRARDTSSTHMAMPEPIDWEDVDAFKISGTYNTEYDDLDLDAYLTNLAAKSIAITIEKLKSRGVSVRYSRSSDFDGAWSIYQCLVSEQKLGTELYVLIEGRWFNVSKTLSDEVDAFASSLSPSPSALPNRLVAETEPQYNLRVATAAPGDFLHLDAKIKRPGGAASGIEFCDLLSAGGELLHVKRKTTSSTLSHLFAQGSVSATTFVGDSVFRDELRSLVASEVPPSDQPKWLALLPDGSTAVNKSKYRVSFVVLADSTKPGVAWLPFFSKLNLLQHGRQIRNLGFDIVLTRVGT